MQSVRLILKAGFDIVIEIDRDSDNTSIITIHRNNKKEAETDAVNNNNNPILNYYTNLQVRNKHIQNYNYSLSHPYPYIKEGTSATSEPPTMLQSNTISGSTDGGLDATEVSSLL